MSAATHDRIVFLFCHGGSLTKDCWNPIIRRLQASSLLQRVPCEMVTFNWHFHGDKKDRSVEAELFYRAGLETSPRVKHPLTNWPEWTPAALNEEIAKLRADDGKLSRRTHIVGVGHSMGAVTLFLVEMAHPGTLDGIVAFEPTFDDGSFQDETNIPIRDAIVRGCIARVDEWDTWDEMEQYMAKSREFRRWDREVLAEFLKEGVEKTEDGRRWRLVMSRKVEAAMYSAQEIQLLTQDFVKVKCKVVLEPAENTVFFHEESIKELAQQLNGRLIVSDVIPKSTHSVCVELPAVCAERILQALKHFPIFPETSSSSKL